MTDIIHDYTAIASRMLGEHRPKPKPLPPIHLGHRSPVLPCLTCDDRGAIPDPATGRNKACPDCEPAF
jgi:hypothetical protein